MAAPHRWGLNWLKYHQQQRHFEHIERMGYKSLKLFEWMWNNGDFCNDLLASAPEECIFILRDIPLSHQHDNVDRDPVEAGRYHAQQWAEKIRRGEVKLPLDRCYFQGVNEYDTKHKEAGFNAYSETFIVELWRQAEARAAAWVFGTGHPHTYNYDPKAKPNWEPFASSAAALIEHNGIACLHEYGVAHSLDWGNHIGRSIYCPYPVTVVYDEFGIDYGIVEHGNNLGYLAFVGDNQPFKRPEDYVNWLDNAQFTLLTGLKHVGSPLTVHSFQIFAFDTDSTWKSFNLIPVMDEMERKNWTWVDMEGPKPPSAPPKKELRLPFVSMPSVQPGKQEAEENWRRAIDFLLDQEGGYINDPLNPGGESKYGITKSAYPHLDIKGLSRQEAADIYFADYWQPSGADIMAWPLCLVHFASYVQNPSMATKVLEESKGSPVLYLAKRLEWHAKLAEWPDFGRTWARKIARLMEVIHASD